MSDIAIKVEGLGKRYKIGKLQRRHDTLRDRIADARVFNLFKRRNGNGQVTSDLRSPTSDLSSSDTLWALKDVSFEVKQGEVVGIIGRNGAGKSTLLKILSRITEPTEGYADINGRVASLLEVGTGFHPELTGRENIYLNGSILGMKRAEIQRRFDEMVAFAEIEKFIDTPVKYYSSGMYLRLAFAVAAHLEPEILVVDEVLAVGDAEFQKKCLGKMDDVAKQGRTILFVSHNMAAIKSLCQRGIFLDGGLLVSTGNADQIVDSYLQSANELLNNRVWKTPHGAPGNDKVRVRRVAVERSDQEKLAEIECQEPISVDIDYWVQVPGLRLNLSLVLHSQERVMVFSCPSVSDAWFGRQFSTGLYHSRCRIPADLLNDGRYSVTILFVKDAREAIYRLDDALIFDVHDNGEGRNNWYGKWSGVVRPRLEWFTEQKEES